MFLISFVQLSAIGKLWNLVPTFYIKNDYQHVLYIFFIEICNLKNHEIYIILWNILWGLWVSEFLKARWHFDDFTYTRIIADTD